MTLLEELAPNAVTECRADCDTLVDELGRLPLALVVAGRMLSSERGRAVGTRRTLEQVRNGEALLRENVPPDMAPLLRETSLSVANVLQRSVKLLDSEDQIRFAQLSVYAFKPAIIDLEMMSSVWQANESQALSVASTLVSWRTKSSSSSATSIPSATCSRSFMDTSASTTCCVCAPMPRSTC